MTNVHKCACLERSIAPTLGWGRAGGAQMDTRWHAASFAGPLGSLGASCCAQAVQTIAAAPHSASPAGHRWRHSGITLCRAVRSVPAQRPAKQRRRAVAAPLHICQAVPAASLLPGAARPHQGASARANRLVAWMSWFCSLAGGASPSLSTATAHPATKPAANCACRPGHVGGSQAACLEGGPAAAVTAAAAGGPRVLYRCF